MRSVFLRKDIRNNNGTEEVTYTPIFLKRNHGKSAVDDNGNLIRTNAVGDTPESASGYQIIIDTLTYIYKEVTTQKFFEVTPSEYLPIDVGQGSYAANIVTNITFSDGNTFESGNVNGASNTARLGEVETAVQPVNTEIVNWAMKLSYSLFDVEQALVANNWDLIQSKHEGLKRVWDLGIQRVAFLGSRSNSNVRGLLNQTGVNVNTSLITKSISSMTAEEFSTLVAGLANAYSLNTNRTALPDTFLMPTSDFLGLQVPTSPTFPMVNKLDYLLTALKGATGNSNFQIKHVAYADKDFSEGALDKQTYVLYRRDPRSIRMNIPTNYRVGAASTPDNFNFVQVAHGQYCGVTVLRRPEILYFRY